MNLDSTNTKTTIQKPLSRDEMIVRMSFIIYGLMQIPILTVLLIGSGRLHLFVLLVELIPILGTFFIFQKRPLYTMMVNSFGLYGLFAAAPYLIEAYHVSIPVFMATFIFNTYSLNTKLWQRINVIAVSSALGIYYTALYHICADVRLFILVVLVSLSCFVLIYMIINYFIKDREKYQSELEKTNSFLRQIADLNPHFVYAKDLENKFIFINKTMAEHYGESPDEMLGQNVNAFYLRSEKQAPFGTHKDANGLEYHLVTVKDPINQLKYHELIKRPLLNQNHEKIGILGVSIDVTARKKAEEAVAISQQRYRRIYENTQTGIATSIKGKFYTVNDAFCNMTGFKADEIIGKTIDTVMHPEDYEYYARSNAFQNNSTFEHRFIRKDGSIGHAIVHLQTLNLDGVNEEAVAVLTDISLLKERDLALKEEEAMFRTLYKHSPNGIEIYEYFRDENGTPVTRLVARNDKLREIFGRTDKELDELKGQANLQLSPKYQSDGRLTTEHLEELKKRFVQNRHFSTEWRYLRPNGEEVDVYYTIQEIDLSKKKIITGIYQDITDIKKAELLIKKQLDLLNKKNEELKKFIDSNLQLENFAYLASHDLKEPIRTLVGFSQILGKSADDRLTEQEKEYIQFIINSSMNMKQLIEDLLSYSRVNTDKLNIISVPIRRIINQVADDLQAVIQDKEVSIKAHSINQTLLVDETQIRQLFQNLISNAIKYSSEARKPIITISVEERPDEHLFKITDNGIGIAKENHERIFLLFRKLHSKEEYEGTGIGLALCKNIVENHGGKIWLESEEGKGTTFYFTISKHLHAQV